MAAWLTITANAQPRDVPRNDLPQPYRTTRDWGQLPPGVKWAAVTAVEPAPDGTHLRHPSLLRQLVRRPHRSADPEVRRRRQAAQELGRGHVRLPARRHRRSRRQPLGDRRARRRRQGAPGLQVQPRRQGADDARQGRRQRARGPTSSTSRPTCVVAPSGDIFVTDSHRNGKNNRVVKFTKDGTFVKEWGTKGSGRGEISEPHTIAMDSRGRLFVGDRENNRIQIFDQEGTLLDRVAAVRPAERHRHHRATTPSTSPTRSRGPIPARASCRGSRRASASAARATAR